MLQQDGFMWEYRIPGSVMVKGGMKVLLMGFVAAYLLGEVVSWFFRSSFTLVLINAAKKGEIGVYAGGGFLLLIVVITLVVTAILYRNGYPARFTISGKGVLAETMPEQQNVNRTIETVAVLTSIASGRVGGFAAAAASRASETAFISWADLRKIIPDPAACRIRLKNSWRTVIVLYTAPEVYDHVLQSLYQYQQMDRQYQVPFPAPAPPPLTPPPAPNFASSAPPPLSPPAAPAIFCTSCGQQNIAEASFCRACGKALANS